MATAGQQHDFAEAMARCWEYSGGRRTDGLCIGWLMVCEPDAQTQAQVRNALTLSAGAVSTTLRDLERLGLVERQRVPGDRSSYYRFPEHGWRLLMSSQISQVRAFRSVAEAGLSTLPSTRPERVTEFEALMRFLDDDWPNSILRMEDHLRKATP